MPPWAWTGPTCLARPQPGSSSAAGGERGGGLAFEHEARFFEVRPLSRPLPGRLPLPAPMALFRRFSFRPRFQPAPLLRLLLGLLLLMPPACRAQFIRVNRRVALNTAAITRFDEEWVYCGPERFENGGQVPEQLLALFGA